LNLAFAVGAVGALTAAGVALALNRDRTTSKPRPQRPGLALCTRRSCITGLDNGHYSGQWIMSGPYNRTLSASTHTRSQRTPGTALSLFRVTCRRAVRASGLVRSKKSRWLAECGRLVRSWARRRAWPPALCRREGGALWVGARRLTPARP